MNLVSVIIPAYNAEKYISATINSVLNQTYTDWELIIIDDGSTDGTANIITGFLQDPRIKYYYQKNTGVCGARNNGLKLAKGDSIALLDADDGWEPNNLEKKISILKSEPEVAWVFSDMYNADENLNKKDIAPIGTDKEILKSLLLWEGEVVPGPCSNIVLKAECIRSGIMFDTALSLSADMDFCLQLAEKFKGKRIPEPLFSYRILPGSMSKSLSTAERDGIYVYKKAARKNLFHSFGFKQKCFSNLYLILAGNWWVNGNNKGRGLYFIIRSLVNYPPNVSKLIKKFI